MKGDLPSGYASIFAYSLLDPAADVDAEAAAYRPPFGHLALLAQVPGVDVVARVEAEKGAPLTERERSLLDERLGAVRRWLDGYAPESAIVAVQPTLPACRPRPRRRAAELSGRVGRCGRARKRRPPAMPGRPRSSRVANERGLDGRRAFGAIYRAFLGRTNGPRAGWLLASLDRDVVQRRLREAAAAGEGEAA